MLIFTAQAVGILLLIATLMAISGAYGYRKGIRVQEERDRKNHEKMVQVIEASANRNMPYMIPKQ